MVGVVEEVKGKPAVSKHTAKSLASNGEREEVVVEGMVRVVALGAVPTSSSLWHTRKKSSSREAAPSLRMGRAEVMGGGRAGKHPDWRVLVNSEAKEALAVGAGCEEEKEEDESV